MVVRELIAQEKAAADADRISPNDDKAMVTANFWLPLCRYRIID